MQLDTKFNTLKLESDILVDHASSISSDDKTLRSYRSTLSALRNGTRSWDGSEEKLGKLIQDLRNSICDPRLEEWVNGVVIALLARVIRKDEKVKLYVADKHEKPLMDALSEAKTAYIGVRGYLEVIDVNQVEKDLQRLIQNGVLVHNTDLVKQYLTPQQINSQFNFLYYHPVNNGINSLWEPVVFADTDKTQTLGQAAFKLENAFYNYLCDIALHPNCSRELATAIRYHLIGFPDKLKLWGNGTPIWHERYDIQGMDLRVLATDITHANKNGFQLPADANDPKYCKPPLNYQI